MSFSFFRHRRGLSAFRTTKGSSSSSSERTKTVVDFKILILDSFTHTIPFEYIPCQTVIRIAYVRQTCRYRRIIFVECLVFFKKNMNFILFDVCSQTSAIRHGYWHVMKIYYVTCVIYSRLRYRCLFAVANVYLKKNTYYNNNSYENPLKVIVYNP